MKSLQWILLLAIGIYSNTIYSQQNLSKEMTNQEIVLKFLEGFNNPAQIQTSLALLADDYHFKNPMIELHSKAEFIALAQEIGAVLTGVNVISAAENGDWVATFYEFKSSIPGLESNTASEWFRLEDGMIKESR